MSNFFFFNRHVFAPQPCTPVSPSVKNRWSLQLTYMASFTNPFATIGDYRDKSAGLADPEEVSYSYLSGVPDVRTLSDPQVTIIFKNLLKKDAVTRDRALTEFIDFTSSDQEIDDETHLAFIQIYAKFSIDVLPSIRQKTHTALKSLYSALGKRTTKHLQSSVGPWLAGTHDPDPTVSAAAEDAWTAVFPGKRDLVINKMRQPLIDFVDNVLTGISPTTISDMRYISKEDADQKYYRVVKTAVDIITSDLHFEEDAEPPHFLLDDSVWKFLTSKNQYLVRSVLTFAAPTLASFAPEQLAAFWKNLLKALRTTPPQVAVDVLKSFVDVTSKHPEIWFKGEVVPSLAQFIVNSSTSPRTIWPLLFNIFLKEMPESIGFQQEATASLILKSIRKVLPDVVGDAEASAWGCYLALCSKPQELKYVEQAIDATAKRCLKPVLPPLSASLAARLKDLAKVEGVEPVVARNLEGNAGFAKVIAASGMFDAQLQAAIENLPPKTVGQIVAMKPDLDIDLSKWEPSPELLEVALHSSKIDANSVIDRLVPEFAGLVMEKAPKLSGVHRDLSKYVDESDPASLRAAILAHGKLIYEEHATVYVNILANLALTHDDGLFELGRAVSGDEQFCVPILRERHDLLSFLNSSENRSAAKIREKLASGDSVKQLLLDLEGPVSPEEIDMFVERAVKLATDTDSARAILHCQEEWLDDSALFIDKHSQWVYEIDCWHLTRFDPPKRWWPTVGRAFFMYHVYQQVKDKIFHADRLKVMTECILVASACVGHIFIDRESDLTDLCKFYLAEFENFEFDDPLFESAMWELTEGHSAKNFHAVQTCSHFMSEERLMELSHSSRNSFLVKSLRAALIAQNSAIQSAPWYDRYQLDLLNDLNLLTIPMADVSVTTERLQETLLKKIMNTCGSELVEFLKLLHQLEYYPSKELVKYSLNGGIESQFAILQMVEPGEYSNEIAEAACRLLPDVSQFDRQVHGLYLKHAKGALAEHIEVNIGALYNLIEMGGDTLPWVAYGYLHEHAVLFFRDQLLASNLEETAICTHLQKMLRDPAQEYNHVVWLLFMAYVTEYVEVTSTVDRKVRPAMSVFSEWEDVYQRILKFIGMQLENVTRSELAEIRAEELPSQSGLSLATHLLYTMSMSLGSIVRSWYREVRDRRLLKNIEDTLQIAVLPAILRTVAHAARNMRDHGQLEGTSISEQLREFRALVELDDHSVEVIIHLPSLYPAKSASVEIKNLVGVPEAKRRAWVLEAEFSVQNGAIISAMKGLILKLSNFLEGIEPCAICYQVVLNGKQLPNKTCSTCHNTYHSDCLFKWFNSNKSRLCPMCRSSF